ncbi:MAG: tRNA1(Val) A37 N6-methylase TrmN6 [Yoonia sp.]|jgi:tRNA1(Val) A37 N6-methylase TrmN6
MDTTTDAFLNGKVTAVQPAKGYRAGVDAVLLAACVPARSGERVLELGCGVGVASLCLAARVPDLDITGIEVQPDYAALAVANGMNAVMADLRTLPDSIRNTQYHHVMANPPYFDRGAGSAAPNTGRDIAMGGDTPLGDWLNVATKRLAPKGYFTLVLRIERLPEVLSHLQGRLGSIIVRPICARDGQEPHLFLLQARHSGRAPFRLLPALIMHDGTMHDADRENYTDRVRGILRNGDALIITD